MDFEEFQHLALSRNVVPVNKTILADTLTPVLAYLRLRDGSRGSFLFESVEGGERFARYSFIGLDPIALLAGRGNTTKIVDRERSYESKDDFFEIVRRYANRFRYLPLPSLPRFTGGLVGFIGYDAVRFIEALPSSVRNDADLPDSLLGLFTSVIVFDHLRHQATIIVNVFIDQQCDLRQHYDRACEKIGILELHLTRSYAASVRFETLSDHLQPETTREAFEKMVRDAKTHIYEGDIFQVVLSQRFSTEFSGDSFQVYRALRVINPSPYLYYLDLEGFKLVGSSPEILVRMENDSAEVYPIAGTRRRGKTYDEDIQLGQELLADEKERAEHVMLVDLGRNDLGRVCEPGTIRTDRLMEIVRYSHVMHLASRVCGKVLPGRSCVDVLKATFPAGTVSGAPKIRAMEIIDQLEHSRRTFYAGAVGYIDFSGSMDFCITIRTMLAAGNRIYLQSGAGIVADSIPEEEYAESINKAQALVEALRMAEGIN